MSFWNDAMTPKIGSSKKPISLSKSKNMQQNHRESKVIKQADHDCIDHVFIKEEEVIEQEPLDMELDHDFVQQLEEETPRLESLSVSDNKGLKRKRVGQDMFTQECVKEWQSPRIKAWEARHSAPDSYYYRFVVPGEGQQNGAWSAEEHKLFMQRYHEWMTKGYKIGNAWGVFSMGIPHRVGYQCMNYYRKLVSDGKLKDESYTIINGKLKQVVKDKAFGSHVLISDLGPAWQDEDVKQQEKQVDQWIKEFHGSKLSARPVSKPKTVIKSMPRTNISDLVKKMPSKPLHDDFMDIEPQIAHLSSKDWEKDWKDRLEHYRQFIEPYLDKHYRMAHWKEKQQWRRGLTTSEMLLRRDMAKKPSVSIANIETPPKIQQSSLSRFFTGVKKQKIDTPEDLISYVRIPNDLFSGVKIIQPLSKSLPDPSKTHYYAFDDMEHMLSVLDSMCSQQDTSQSALECILADPPWDFYVPDGKHDDSCHLNLGQFKQLMEKVIRHMSAGMVFVWTHKLIQADVVRTMYQLDCRYVENLVWFKKSVNNGHLDEPSPYFSATKEILLMFKKGDGFEMRHQRSSDVIIDFERPSTEWIQDEFTGPKPPSIYEMIETLLPKAGYDESIGRGRLLELWAKKKGPRREGWIAIHQNKSK